MPDEPNPLGPKPAIEWTPGLQLIVYDPEVIDNIELDKVELNATAGARLAEAIDAALGSQAWRSGADTEQLGDIAAALAAILAGGD